MKAKLVYFITVCLFTATAFAQSTNGEIKHTVKPGQTLYFISKKYDLSVQEIRANNPQILDDLIIKPDQVLVLPVKNTIVKESASQFKVHVVKTKETLYSISKLYDVSVNDIIKLNNLDDANIQIGQTLRVKALDKKENADVKIEPEKTDIANIKEKKEEQTIDSNEETASFEDEVIKNKDAGLYKELFMSYADGNNTLMKDKGIGNYLDTNSDSYLMVVNNVPSGQIAKVRNLMNNKVIYLKVVGPVSKKDADNNISIKISKAAAKDLNIIEDRFLAEWTWYQLGEKKPNTTKSTTPFDDF